MTKEQFERFGKQLLVTDTDADTADPDQQNENRAQWALQAVHAFQHATGADPDTALHDLMTDLRHLCDRIEGESFAALVRSSDATYHAEITDDD